MGYGRWSSSDYTTYTQTTKLETLSRSEVFSQCGVHESLNPARIVLRESRDSDTNPNSTPIIIGLDVTGSMGFVAESIAKEQLNTVMTRIIEEKPVDDPHLMFMAVGDIRSDVGPLQVSQFETDIRIIDQLRNIWLEGRGGGNHTESYDLPWYFAVHKTDIDVVKRGKKGYLFTIGDEYPPNEPLPRNRLSSILNVEEVREYDSPKQLLDHASEKYKVFHLLAEEGAECRSVENKKHVRQAWKDLMGRNVVFVRNHKHIDDIIIAVLKIAEGADPEKAIKESKVPEEVRYALDI